MAQYRALMSGQSGSTVSRLGHKSSGCWAQVAGWNVGASVEARWEESDDPEKPSRGDVVTVSFNHGSNRPAATPIMELFKHENEVLAQPGQGMCRLIAELALEHPDTLEVRNARLGWLALADYINEVLNRRDVPVS